MLLYFLERSDENIAALSADGAYDQESCYTALERKVIRAILQPRSDAVHHKEDDHIRASAVRNRNTSDIHTMGRVRLSMGCLVIKQY
jgi:hypothetical protein